MNTLDRPRAKRLDPRRFHLDKTINLGHIITTVALVFAGVGAWVNISNEVSGLKAQSAQQEKRDISQDAAVREKFETIRDELRDIRLKVDEIYRSQANGGRPR